MAFHKWENNPALIPFIRPNRTKEDLERYETVTAESLKKRLEHDVIYLIYNGDERIGEMNYPADPKDLHKKEAGTAWIRINIGEESARRKGLGQQQCDQTVSKAGVPGDRPDQSFHLLAGPVLAGYPDGEIYEIKTSEANQVRMSTIPSLLKNSDH